jgi:hypothetical protein
MQTRIVQVIRNLDDGTYGEGYEAMYFGQRSDGKKRRNDTKTNCGRHYHAPRLLDVRTVTEEHEVRELGNYPRMFPRTVVAGKC